MGKIRNPQYRIVVADARTKRDGRAIEYVGLYHPKEDPSRIEVNSERVQHWLSVGAQPSEPVIAILSKTGDWQKFKGLPPPTEPLKVAAARLDRKAAYEVEAKAAAGIVETETTKSRKATTARAAKATGAKADKAKGDEPKAKADKAKGDEPRADQSKADEAAAGASAEAKPDAAAASATVEEPSGAAADAQG
jgi:small subunit ribosomal protein S16